MVALVAGIGPSYPYTAASKGTQVTLTHSHRFPQLRPPDYIMHHLRIRLICISRMDLNLSSYVKTITAPKCSEKLLRSRAQ